MTSTKIDEQTLYDLSTYRSKRDAGQKEIDLEDFSQSQFEIKKGYKSNKDGYNKNKNYPDQGGEHHMDSKEYVDLKVNALEKNINDKFVAQQELFSEKLNHLDTKLDNISTLISNQHELTIQKFENISTTKIAEFEKKLQSKEKERRNFTWVVMGVGVAAATLIVTIVIPLLSPLLK